MATNPPEGDGHRKVRSVTALRFITRTMTAGSNGVLMGALWRLLAGMISVPKRGQSKLNLLNCRPADHKHTSEDGWTTAS